MSAFRFDLLLFPAPTRFVRRCRAAKVSARRVFIAVLSAALMLGAASTTRAQSAPAYVVTVATDEANGVGNGSNCVDTNVSSSGNGNCGLRDAVAAANALTGMTPTISFSISVFSTAQTIQITQPIPITITQNVIINGPGANLLTIEGGTAPYNGSQQTQNYGIFQMNNAAVTLSGVTLAYGYGGTTGNNGGAVSVSGGSLTVTGCAFSGNLNGSSGGAIYTNAPLTVSNSTFLENSAEVGTHSGSGGAIYALSTLTVVNSTFYKNSAVQGGAIYGNAAVSVTNSTFFGNETPTGYNAAIYSGGFLNATNDIFNDENAVSGESVYSVGGASLNSNILYTPDSLRCSGGSGCVNMNEITANPNLTNFLGSYGGPTQTLLPQSGSSAICAGVAPTVTTDQRGVPISGSRYGQTTCYDIGAVQTEYVLSFATQPSNVLISPATMFPAPTMSFIENGINQFGLSPSLTAATDADGSLASSPATIKNGGFLNLSFTSVQTGDSLIATYALTPAITLSTTSTTFDVLSAPIAASAANSSVVVSRSVAPIGTTLTVTITLKDANNQPITGARVSFSPTGHALLGSPSGVENTFSGNTITAGMYDGTAETAAFTVTLSGAVSGTLTGSAQFLPLVGVAGSGALGLLDTAGDVVTSDVAGGGTGAAVNSRKQVYSINGGSSLGQYTFQGALLNSYGGLGLSGATALAIDGNSNIFVTNGNGSVSVISSAGAAISTTQGSTTSAASSIAIDNSGDVWIANPVANTVDEVIGGAAPTAPPATAAQNLTPGAKP